MKRPTRSNPSVLVVVPTAYTLGGLAVWADYLATGLQQRGWDVTLGVVSGPRHHIARRYLEAYPFSRTVVIHTNSCTSYDRISAVRRTIQAVCPDIVLTANIPHAIWAAGIERTHGRNVKAVMSCHGIQSDLFADMRLLRSSLEAVVCTNRLACRLAEVHGQIAPSRVYHAACGTAVPSQLTARHSNNRQVIGYCGRLEQPQKRVFDLVSIALELRRRNILFTLLIAGAGPEEATLRQRIQEHGIDDCFEFLGFCSPSEVSRRFYDRLDVLLVTSAWETGPIVIWEAMAAGVPVVTSRYIGSGSEGLLQHRTNCLMFDVGDSTAAANELERFLDVDLREEIRANAFTMAHGQLSTETSVKQWDVALRSVLSESLLTERVETPQNSVSGRLDEFLTPFLAQFLRRILKRLPPDSGPGGEWPHTIAGADMDEDQFLRLARHLDSPLETTKIQ